MILLIFLGAASLPASTGIPKIAFESLELDLGKVAQGDPAKGAFKFRNLGSAILKIVDVVPGCGCTSTLLSAGQIKPGESGEIAITVSTTGITGPMRKTVVVTTNDPKQPEINLIVAVVVEPEVALSQPALFFGNISANREVTREVILTIPTDKTIRVVGAESSNKDIRLSLSPVAETNGKRVRLSVTHKAGAKPGYFFGTAVIKTTSRRTPELTLGIRGTVDPPQPD